MHGRSELCFLPRFRFFKGECCIQVPACNHDAVVFDNGVSGRGLPLDELSEVSRCGDGGKDPGARAQCGRCGMNALPGVLVGRPLVERNAASRNVQEARQRTSQKMPMTMVLTPVNCPTARPSHSAKRTARPAT